MTLLATFKHISSKNADYGAAEAYLTFEHDEFTMKPTLDENGRLIPREDYRISSLNCGGEDFAVACMRANLRYEKNQKREDVKSHHYIISFDPRDGTDNGLTVDRAQELGEQFCKEHFPGHQALICTHPDGHNHSGNIKALSIMERSITMSEKRRDNKNRILRTGESQRKDGRYAYKYIDTFGKPQFVYSWKLVPTDKTPAGKRDDIALREKEKEIQKDLDDGIDHIGKKMTVCQLYAKQIRHRANVRHGTKQGRKQLMRILQEDKLGACRIENVKLSDAKEWALRMKEKGYGFKTINNHKRSLKAAFYTAIQDDCIRKNPFDFQLNTVLEDDTEPKEPLSPTQEAAFLSFVQHDKVYQKYYDEIIILLGTGLRISELCGLTEADIDLDKQLINVDHQLLKIADVGYYVETPKTKSGNRVIPMSEKVLEAFQRVLNKRKYVQPVILEGYTKFLFLNRNGLPKVAVNYESMFRGLVRKYNKTQKVALPKVMTPHTLRHTFCTTLANAGMNPKALQYIMGHSNINMTLNYYAHTTSETSITEMKRLIA